MVNFVDFFLIIKTCGPTVLTDRSVLIRQKMTENTKCDILTDFQTMRTARLGKGLEFSAITNLLIIYSQFRSCALGHLKTILSVDQIISNEPITIVQFWMKICLFLRGASSVRKRLLIKNWHLWSSRLYHLDLDELYNLLLINSVWQCTTLLLIINYLRKGNLLFPI